MRPLPLRVHGLFLKWIFAACFVAGAAALAKLRGTPDASVIPNVTLGASQLVGVTWLYVAWWNFPPEDRHFTPFGRVSAFGAIVRLLIPCYGTIWIFTGLSLFCKAINESLTRREMPMRVPYALAVAPTIVFIGGSWLMFRGDVDARMMLVCATGALWFLFMLQCDNARRFMILACLAEREKIAQAQRELDESRK